MSYPFRRRRRGKVGLEKDPYIQHLLWEYAIKAIPLCSKNDRSNFHEFLFKMLKLEDLKKVVSLAQAYMNAEEPKLASEDQRDLDLREMVRCLSQATYREDKFAGALDQIKTDYPKVYSDLLDYIICTFSKYSDKKVGVSDFLKRLKNLNETFKLTEKETEVLAFLYLIKLDDDANALFASDLHMDDVKKSARLYCKFFEITSYELQKMLSKKSNLLKTGLADTSRRNELEISDLVIGYLSGVADLNLMENFISKANLDDALEIEKHNIPKTKLEDIVSLLSTDHGLNILLHGSPGTGKSEFVKSLGKTLGKEVYFINQKDEDEDESLDHRKTGIIAAMNMLDPKTSIVVIDECDQIINSTSNFMGFSFEKSKDDTKAWLNDLMETTNQKFIWISNKVKGVDPSTKRRFSYSLEFHDLSFNQRLNVWKTQIESKSVDFIDFNELEKLARKYKVNAGGIALALKDVSGMSQLKSKKEKLLKLENILGQHLSFVFGENKLSPLQESYSLEAINSDAKLDRILESTQKFLDYSNNDGFKEIANLNFLLHGPSGTGKTEFAKYLSHTLGKELLVKRMSDLQSMFVGETEKQIARAFKEAEVSGSILFLDEADSLFINRESAQRSWEVSQTNELLCQMENFRGILICATNHKTNMDVAVMRRFNHKIKFDYLTNDGKELLAEKVLSLNLDEESKKRLSRIQGLTPGDFKVVRQKNFFYKNVTTEELLSQLESETLYKRVSKPLGLSV